MLFGDDYDTSDGTCIRDYIHILDLARKKLGWQPQFENARAIKSVWDGMAKFPNGYQDC